MTTRIHPAELITVQQQGPSRNPFQVQQLGHIVLNCTDLGRSTSFYTDVLGFKISDRYDDALRPGGMVFLRCSPTHHTIALVGGGTERSPNSGLNHFAMEVATLEEVFRARDWLRARGAKIVFEGRRRAGCQIAVEFEDPDGNHLEIYWGVDEVGTDGYVRPAAEWREAHTLEDAVRNPVPGQALPTLEELGRATESDTSGQTAGAG